MKKFSYYLAAFAFGAISSVNAYSQKEPGPPPPPPPPPKPPKVMTKQAGPGSTVDEFYKNNPAVSHIYAADKRIMIELQNGTKEEYNIYDEKEKKNLLSKYGKVPLLPPPPPPPPRPPKKVI